MGANAGSGSSQQRQSSKPWKAQQPYLKGLYKRAEGVSGDEWTAYPGASVAPRDEATTAGLDYMAQRGAAGSQDLRDAQAQNASTVRGDRFGSNPYLDSAFNRGAENVSRAFNRTVLPNLESRFASAGRMDSGAYQGALGEAGRMLGGELSNMATDIYGGDYQRERDRQTGAIDRAVPLSEADYLGAEHQVKAGLEREGFSQQMIDDLVSRFEFSQAEPYNRLARYSSLIGAPVMESQGSGSSKQQNWGFSI